jgi:hypothetical protein
MTVALCLTAASMMNGRTSAADAPAFDLTE